ncbi:glycoside hydrolase family 16 protein [Neptunitalea lumnitzerae]|nr:glycoside hydrolase family 16 protein [Neptunitalea sp. Y10]
MKNYIKQVLGVFALLLVFSACQEEDATFGDIVTPTNLMVDYAIEGQDGTNLNGDGSGLVDFTATAEGAISYKYVFSDNTNYNSASGELTKRFSSNGVNTYTVTVIANGTAGVTTSTTFEVTVFSSFSDDEAVQMLTGGTSKTWYWAASEPGHLGLGPNDQAYEDGSHTFAAWYQAVAFEKSESCMYDTELTYTLNGDIVTFEQVNVTDMAFIQGLYAAEFGFGDEGCYPFDVTGVKTVSFGPANSVATVDGNYRGTAMTYSDGGFMGFYAGSSDYEIIELTDNRMVVRVQQANEPLFAWYHTFTTTTIADQSGGGSGGTDFTNLVWSDEFDTDGAPDAANWSYNIGTGDNGWGNAEAQYYTDRADNVKVENGMLKITAKAESYSGSDYTSARIVSEGNFDFTYGKVEVRAKLPSGGGTWPAIWMLGSDYATNSWPGCGEIDIMEHVGNDQGTIHATLHYPGNSGGNGNTGSTTLSDALDEFHVYSVVWSDTSIDFYIDENTTPFHSVANDSGLPFNSDFFLILNVAMGGNFGGAIDGAFTESTMEVDYVRVYQ